MNRIASWIQRDLPEMLNGIPVEQVFSNGKMEREIKCLLAVAWERKKVGRRICVLNKDFNGGQLDLLGLERGRDKPNGVAEPQLWIELKCSLWQDYQDARKCAKQACKQVSTAYQQIAKNAKQWKESKKIKKQLRNSKDEKKVERLNCQLREIKNFQEALVKSEGYIVHLINSCPTNEYGLLPGFVLEKFPKPKKNLTRGELIDCISAIYSESSHHAETREVNIWAPDVTALIIRLKP